MLQEKKLSRRIKALKETGSSKETKHKKTLLFSKSIISDTYKGKLIFKNVKIVDKTCT